MEKQAQPIGTLGDGKKAFSDQQRVAQLACQAVFSRSGNNTVCESRFVGMPPTGGLLGANLAQTEIQ